MKDLRIVFMGTPEFAVHILDTIRSNGGNVVGVITVPDKPAGRGRKMHESAVKKYAINNDLPILQPLKLKDPTFLKALESWQAHVQVVVAFRMLPIAVWKMPKHGTFNLHASLLPRYRGAAPINWTIINGDIKTGVTTFFIDEEIDTGNIISQEEVDIEKNETAGSLHDKLMTKGGHVVVDTLKAIENGTISTTIQKDKIDPTPAPKLTSENTMIDWNMTGVQIDAFVRGLFPYPIAKATMQNNGETIIVKIHQVVFELEEHSEVIGKITTTKKKIKVAVENGYIEIVKIQIPGKRAMAAIDVLNGYAFSSNAQFISSKNEL